MPQIGVTGHRGLSAEVESYVREEILQLLRGFPSETLTGVSCIADGADSYFADIVVELGGRIVVMVPAAKYREELPEEHHREYDRLIARAAVVRRLDHEESDPDAHMDASRIIVDEADLIIAVWDGQPSRAPGGTADVVAYARQVGKPVFVVWPAGKQRS